MTDSAIDLRLEALESKATFTDDLLAALNDVIVAQDQRIATLQRQIELLHGQIKSVEVAGHPGDTTPEPPPPHY